LLIMEREVYKLRFIEPRGDGSSAVWLDGYQSPLGEAEVPTLDRGRT